MDKATAIKKLSRHIEVALECYSASEVDIVVDDCQKTIDIMYHSRHNSFPIFSNVCPSDCFTEPELSDIAYSYDIGYQI